MVHLLAVQVDGDLPQDHQVVPAAEILTKVVRGELVDYNNITIVGDLDLRPFYPLKVGTMKITNSNISSVHFDDIVFEGSALFKGTSFGNVSFNNTRFVTVVDFENTSFEKASFVGTIFEDGAIFGGVKFNNDVKFRETQFGKLVTFDKAVFNNDVSFNNVQFLGDSSFNGTKFERTVDILFSHFGKGALFSNSKFRGRTDFHGSKFDGGADFSYANCTDIVSFNLCLFGGPTYFDNSIFQKKATFGFTRFNMPASFDDTVFAEVADFNMARFSDAVRFSKTHFRDNALLGGVKFDYIIIFRDANFEKMLVLKMSQFHNLVLENATFSRESAISLEDAGFAMLKAPWKSIKDHIEENGAVYLALTKNYMDLDWSDDANDCYYAYRKYCLKNEPPTLMKLLDYLAWIFYGFGVKPVVPVCWSCIIILAFGGIFLSRRSLRKFIRTETIELVPSRDARLEAQITSTFEEKSITFIDPFLFSLANFTSGWTTFLYPFTDFKTTGGHSRLAMMERILGSVFISLILAAIIKTYLAR